MVNSANVFPANYTNMSPHVSCSRTVFVYKIIKRAAIPFPVLPFFFILLNKNDVLSAKIDTKKNKLDKLQLLRSLIMFPEASLVNGIEMRLFKSVITS